MTVCRHKSVSDERARNLKFYAHFKTPKSFLAFNSKAPKRSTRKIMEKSRGRYETRHTNFCSRSIATVPRATCRLGIKRFLASIDCAPVSATATEQRSSLVNAAGCISGWYQFSPGSETETQARDSATDLINLDKLARALYRLPSLPRGQYPS